MIGFYAFIIVALTLVHPHSTSRAYLCKDLTEISNALLEENTAYLSTPLSENMSDATRPPPDIACDKLDANEKRQLCDLAMELVITEVHGGGSFGSFLETESDPEVPPLAESSDPYTVKEISIEGLNVTKRMYWCESKEYISNATNEIGQAEGFYISGSLRMSGSAFIFRPSTTDGEKVIPIAEIRLVSLLETAWRRFLQNLRRAAPAA